MSDDVVGYVPCRHCNEVAEVRKLAKGDGYFTRCKCGTDQRRGAGRQKWIKENMRNSKDLIALKEPEPESKKVGAPEKKQDKKIKPKLWWLLVPLAGIGIIASKTMKGTKQ